MKKKYKKIKFLLSWILLLLVFIVISQIASFLIMDGFENFYKLTIKEEDKYNTHIISFFIAIVATIFYPLFQYED
jgi:ABC-type sulfate transport system permease component